jgi:hypothetical protein
MSGDWRGNRRTDGRVQGETTQPVNLSFVEDAAQLPARFRTST